MTSQQFDEEAVFKAARRLVAEDDRRAYLDRACGMDAVLRGRVEDLLRVDAEGQSFLAAPALDPALDPAATARWSPAEGPGSWVGPYRLMERIGEGGFGLVYVAEQAEPLRRRVALKVIKPGMDT